MFLAASVGRWGGHSLLSLCPCTAEHPEIQGKGDTQGKPRLPSFPSQRSQRLSLDTQAQGLLEKFLPFAVLKKLGSDLQMQTLRPHLARAQAEHTPYGVPRGIPRRMKGESTGLKLEQLQRDRELRKWFSCPTRAGKGHAKSQGSFPPVGRPVAPSGQGASAWAPRNQLSQWGPDFLRRLTDNPSLVFGTIVSGCRRRRRPAHVRTLLQQHASRSLPFKPVARIPTVGRLQDADGDAEVETALRGSAHTGPDSARGIQRKDSDLGCQGCGNSPVCTHSSKCGRGTS